MIGFLRLEYIVDYNSSSCFINKYWYRSLIFIPEYYHILFQEVELRVHPIVADGAVSWPSGCCPGCWGFWVQVLLDKPGSHLLLTAQHCQVIIKISYWYLVTRCLWLKLIKLGVPKLIFWMENCIEYFEKIWDWIVLNFMKYIW